MVSLAGISQETLTEVQQAIRERQHPLGEIKRDITTSLGLVNIDLQRPSKLLVSEITPLLKMTARRPGNGGIETQWKVVTGLNTARLEAGIPEGQRNANSTTTAEPKTAPYSTIGSDDFITFEGVTAAEGFEDERAATVQRLMLDNHLRAELAMLCGNRAAVTMTAKPVITAATAAHGSGNFVQSGDYDVAVVALTAMGLANGSVAGGIADHQSITGADGLTFAYGGGNSKASDPTRVQPGGGNSDYEITVTVTAYDGAAGYAWFVGAHSGEMYLMAITTLNSVVLRVVANTGHQKVSDLSGNDESKNGYTMDGMLNTGLASGVVTTLATGTPGVGTTLTPDGAGSIEELEDLAEAQWNATRVPATHMFLNAQEVRNIYRGIIGAGGAPLFRFNIDATNNDDLTAGRVIGSWMNKYTANGGSLVRLVLHPDMPAGTIMMAAKQLPGNIFPYSNTGDLWEQHVRRDTYQIEYPLKTRRYETGVYEESVFVHYFPTTVSILRNIGNG